jgi:ribosome-associated protein
VDDLSIDSRRTIPAWELQAGFARSGGPGGQHVNKTESKVEIRWWPASTSMALTAEERARLVERLRPRLTAEGELVITSSEERSQLRNRERALEKLAELVRAALVPPKARRKTKPSRGATRRRLDAKRRQSDKKRERREGGD